MTTRTICLWPYRWLTEPLHFIKLSCCAIELLSMLPANVFATGSITKGGYTPFQLAFGRQPMFPDLLEEDVEGNMSLRESLSLEGEIQRAAEMRAAARATLLRHDVQAKLRKALRRWPKGEEREFEPGEFVYFYAPKPLSTRFGPRRLPRPSRV